MITPQLVLIVILVANFLSTLVGCFRVAGMRGFEVGFVQPATEVGRSAAFAEIEVNAVAAIARAHNAAILFIVEFLLPLDRSWWLARNIKHHAIYLTNFIGNSS